MVRCNGGNLCGEEFFVSERNASNPTISLFKSTTENSTFVCLFLLLSFSKFLTINHLFRRHNRGSLSFSLSFVFCFIFFHFDSFLVNAFPFFPLSIPLRGKVIANSFSASFFNSNVVLILLRIVLKVATIMDLGRDVSVGFLLLLSFSSLGSSNLVFEVQHKFKGREKSLSDLRSHDVRRHGRLLSAIDLELGGNGHPGETGLYFAKIGLGTPPNDFHVQVDTGSDILWVNCLGCTNCPTKSDIGVELRLFDPKSSSTSSLVTCDQPFCSATYDGPIPDCKPDLLCQYKVIYGDGSATSGYFVKDNVQLQRAVGNRLTTETSGSVIFGCGAKQSGELGSSSEALDGILGFGQANSSMISQLAASGKVKKIFAHCLDSIKGGGIFAIGDIVEPKMKTTPVMPDQAHYNVVLNGVKVGDTDIELPYGLFEIAYRRGAIIDSGTTLAYLPENIYLPVMEKILGAQPQLKLHTVEVQFTCFKFEGNVDDGFPIVTLEFEEALNLTVYPHEYLFQIRDDLWCVGWQNSGAQSRDGGREVTLLGDLVLQNKLIYYNLEKQVIGWTEYNCSAGIKLKDEKSGEVYTVGAHVLSSAPPSFLIIPRLLPFFLAFTLLFIQ